MKLVILVIKEETLLDDFLKKCSNAGIKNITVFDTDSCESEKGGTKYGGGGNNFNSIKYALDYYNDESKTLFIPIEKNRIGELKDLIKDLIPSHQYSLMLLNLEEMIGFEE